MRFLKFFVFLIGLSVVSLALQPERSLFHIPLDEDGYYALSVSRNIALGNGITIDGATATNGFQPLFVFLCVPAFVLAGGDRALGVRSIFILHWLFYAGTAYLLGCLMRDALPGQGSKDKSVLFWLTLFIYFSTLAVFLQSFNGLETGCALFFYSLAWRYYQVAPLDRWAGLIKLGLILGLAVLARIDAVFLVIVLSLAQLAGGQGGIFARVGRFGAVAGTAFLVSSPWWLYNLAEFGSVMPISGRATQAWALSLGRIKAAALSVYWMAIPPVVMPPIYPHEFDGLARVLNRAVRLFLFVACLFVLRKRWPDLADAFTGRGGSRSFRRTVEFGAYLFLFTLILVLWYMSSSFATWHYNRYFSPLLLIYTVMVSYALWQVWPRVREVFRALFVVSMSVPVLLTAILPHFRTTDRGQFENICISQQLSLVREHVPDEDTVAAGQSGTLGFFRDRVVNLDGKVNPEALRYQSNMYVYLQERDIRWLCDKPFVVRLFLGERPEQHGWRRVGAKGDPHQAGGPFELYRRSGGGVGLSVSH